MRLPLLITILGFFLSFNLNAQSIVVNSSSENEFSFELSLDSEKFEFQSLDVRGDEYLSLQVNQLSKSLDVGNPDLPMYSKLIEVPEDGDINYTIVSKTEKKIDLLDLGFHQEIIPAQRSISKSENPDTVSFSYNSDTYLKDAFYAQKLVSIERLGKMRGKSIARIQIHPFAYHPLTNTLNFVEELEVELTFTSSIKPIDKAYYSNEFESNFSKLLNAETFSKEDFSTGKITRMIILSDPVFESQLQGFIAWKRRKGIDVIEVYKGDTGVGITYESMKAYVQSFYDNATEESPAPTYLLIVGDHEQIPSYNTGEHVSDMYYCEFDGNGDFFPEMFYGRFSATNSSELQPQIDKTLQYEQYTMSDPSYLEEVVLVAGVDASYAPTYGNGQINYGTDYYFNTAHDITTYTYLYPESGNSASAIISDVSGGVGFANYTAHCGPSGWADPNFSVYDVDGLQNEGQYGLMVGNCCLSNQFNGYTCFGEALLRASKKGAIGYIGGSNNTYWNEDYYWGVGSGPISANPTYNETGQAAYDCSFHENGEAESIWATTQAQLMHAGNWAVTESGGADQYYWEIYHLMGDPSVMNYFGVPSELSISHPSALPLGTSALSINTEQHTYVAVSQGGVLLAASYADASGNVQLNFPALTSIETLEIVATKQNKQPYIGELIIMSSDTPFVSVTELYISDSANNLAEPGESVLVNISLQNYGMEGASGLSMSVSSSFPGVTISNVSGSLGDLGAESLMNVSDAFTISLDNNLSDQEVVVVNFLISDSSGNEWESSHSFIVHALLIELTSVESSLVFGESSIVSLTLANNGSFDFTNGSVILASLSDYLNVTSSPNIGSLVVGETTTLNFEVFLDADAPSSTNMDLLLAVSSESYEQTTEFALQTPICQSTALNVVVTINTDSWGSETSWDFTNEDGVVLASAEAGAYESSSTYTATVCAAEGTIMTFNIQDTYGDGISSPNGYWVTVCGNEVAQGDAFGSGTSETFEVTCDVFVEILGCTDAPASNYNAEATIDDGSCEYTIDCDIANGLQLLMVDSYGDGWNGNYFELYDVDGNQLISTTLETGSEGVLDFCLNDGCYTIGTTSDGSWAYEVSWVLVSEGDTLATGVSPSNTSLSLNGDCGFVNGCMDASACNYNSEANVDDGSCEHAAAYYDCDGNCISDIDSDGLCDELEVYGCMDTTASNYNPEATEDDGSCLDPIDCEGLTTVTISMLDSYGDGWNGNVLTVNNQTFTLDAGFEASAIACIDLSSDCISVTCDGGTWPSEVSWTISDGDAIFLSEGAPYNGGIGDCGNVTDVYGCTDATALNYNQEATEDDGSCIYPALGCTDATAINFNPEATEDDGSCEYTIDCDNANGLQLIMVDSYGDGWSGNYFNVYNLDGQELMSVTLETGSEEILDFCLNDGCYTIETTNGGLYTNEVSWSLNNSAGETIATGASPSSSSLSLNTNCGFVNGCMDVIACNYNSEANVDDGSCGYAAAYYDCDGNCISDIDSDGLCDELEVYGCTDSEAMNYDETATEENGTCYYPTDCEFNVVTLNMSDSYGDGWNGNMLNVTSSTGEIVFSTTLESGSESQELYCLENGCYVFTTTNEGGWPYEVSWTLSTSSGIEMQSGEAPSVHTVSVNSDDCTIYGCTDPLASNYNEAATADDGTCEYEVDCNGYNASLTLSMESYGIEHTWSLNDENGIVLYQGGPYQNNSVTNVSLCLEGNSSYTFVTLDTYGDGWNGGAFVLETEECVLMSGGLETGTYEAYDFITSCNDSSYPWEVLITGSNHTIAVGGDTPIDIYGESIANGDWIGVFYTDDNGDLQCAGAMMWNGETYAIPAQGNDSTTDNVDGFQNGEEFVWMIWDASENIIYNANATYLAAMPSQGDFMVNGISGLESLSAIPAIVEQTISLNAGWSMFSTYMMAEEMNVENVLSEIVEDVIIVKDNTGLAYLVEWNYNGIGDILIGEGYQIKMTNAAELVVEGTYMSPEENPITLTEGWNMFGYLRIEASDVMAVFEDMVSEVVIVKNGEGLAYLPQWDFNGIGNLEPGQAYQAKMSSTQVLSYLSNEEQYRLVHSELVENQSSYFSTIQSTGSNMHLVISDEEWMQKPVQGDELVIMNSEGLVVGSAKYTSPTTVVTVWGDDETSLGKDGLELGESLILKFWDSTLKQNLTVDFTEANTIVYQTNEVIELSSLVRINEDEVSVQLFDAVPNPTNNTTLVSFYVPKSAELNLGLFNVLGASVKTIYKGSVDAGTHSFNVDVLDLPAGAYFIKLKSAELSVVKRLNVLK